MIERLTIDEWLAFDRDHPAPTFFARPAWALALARSNPAMTPAPLRIVTSHGNVLLPLMRMNGGALRWREYCGFPLGGYTCFLDANGALAGSPACDEALAVLSRFADAATIVAWPLGPQPSSHAGRQHETSVVDLSHGIDAALQGAQGNFRRMAGQAQRRGVACERSREPGAVDEYYALLEASAKRWGLERPSIPKPLIAAVTEFGARDVEIWFARSEGASIAGGVVFYGSRECFFWSAAMLAEHGRLRPSNALNVALMRAAAVRGMHWYNLGSSEGLPGVARFKEEMGAAPIPYIRTELSRARFRIYAGVRRALRSSATA